MSTIKRALDFLSLFCRIVWREVEPRGMFPEEYRAKGRVSFATAWSISWGIHFPKRCKHVWSLWDEHGNDCCEKCFHSRPYCERKEAV